MDEAPLAAYIDTHREELESQVRKAHTLASEERTKRLVPVTWPEWSEWLDENSKFFEKALQQVYGRKYF